MTDFPITIFHNPACGTSRNVLAAIRSTGREPVVIDYLKTGWAADQLTDLLDRLGLTAREILRAKGTPAAELGLLDPEAPDDAIIAAMVAHPVLVNRPIVVTRRGAILARPSERVFEVLDRRPETFVKEDGAIIRL